MTDVREPEDNIFRMILADIILSAVLHPELGDRLELVPRGILDTARMVIDHQDIVAAAQRRRK
ncbi:MAG: hypothetical protein GY807_24095 [Gammaproteobacteria bacterium]|nr:hypothetical protein [Gammaproteobacteria bacterium]